MKRVHKTKSKNTKRFPRLEKGKFIEVTCEICGKYFKLVANRHKNKYNIHLEKHKIMKENCGCQINLTTFNQKYRHMRITHFGYLGCSKCHLTFKTKENLEKHESRCFMVHICPVCGKKFRLNGTLTNHINQVHEQPEQIENPVEETSKIFNCPDCNKPFESQLKLKVHIDRVHNPSPCPICGKVVKILKRHLVTNHTDNSEMRLHCDQCEKGFNDQAKLRSHMMNVHLKSRPYKCGYGCSDNIGYNDVSNRNSHEKKKHGALHQPGFGFKS
jgi:hypothetical protein